MKILIYILMVCFLITGCSIGKKDSPNEKSEQKKCFDEKCQLYE